MINIQFVFELDSIEEVRIVTESLNHEIKNNSEQTEHDEKLHTAALWCTFCCCMCLRNEKTHLITSSFVC